MEARRIQWLDAARAFAAISVIFCHCVENIYKLTPEAMAHFSLRSVVFAFAGFTYGRIGVPLFLFITGYLLLDRNWDDSSCLHFWRSRWLPLLLCCEAWILIYSVVLKLTGAEINAQNVLRTMLFVERLDMGHFWYMPMIVGVYLFLPIMGTALHALDKRTIRMPLLFAWVFAFGIPLVNACLPIAGITVGLSPQLNLGFSGGVYGIYLLLGWCAKRQAFKRVSSGTCVFVAAISFILCVLLQVLRFRIGNGYYIWYDNALLLVCGLALFELMSRMPDEWFVSRARQANGSCDKNALGRVTASISKYSFATYLVHYPFKILLSPLFKSIPVMMPLRTMLFFVSLVVITIPVCWALSRVPVVGKRLLYLR